MKTETETAKTGNAPVCRFALMHRCASEKMREIPHTDDTAPRKCAVYADRGFFDCHF